LLDDRAEIAQSDFRPIVKRGTRETEGERAHNTLACLPYRHSHCHLRSRRPEREQPTAAPSLVEQPDKKGLKSLTAFLAWIETNRHKSCGHVENSS